MWDLSFSSLYSDLWFQDFNGEFALLFIGFLTLFLQGQRVGR